MLSATGALAFAAALNTTSALALTIALSAAGVLAVTGTLDPLDACAFISTCVQDVLVGHQCGLWTLQGLISVPHFAHTPLAPPVFNAETGTTGAQTSTSHCNGPLSFPTLSGGGESGLATQALPS